MNKLQNSLESAGIGAILKKSAIQLKEGILNANPILVQLLGTCPTLATSTSVVNAVGMGLAATAVLICSNILISLMRNFITRQIRIAAYIVIISGFVSAVELLIKAYFPELDRSLGVFIPLIVVNCIILARAEAFASKNGVLPSAVDGLAMGLGFTLALILLAAVREFAGNGTIAGFRIYGEKIKPAMLFVMPPGAFISLGCLIAVVQKFKAGSERKKSCCTIEPEHEIKKSEEPVDQGKISDEKEEKPAENDAPAVVDQKANDPVQGEIKPDTQKKLKAITEALTKIAKTSDNKPEKPDTDGGDKQ